MIEIYFWILILVNASLVLTVWKLDKRSQNDRAYMRARFEFFKQDYESACDDRSLNSAQLETLIEKARVGIISSETTIKYQLQVNKSIDNHIKKVELLISGMLPGMQGKEFNQENIEAAFKKAQDDQEEAVQDHMQEIHSLISGVSDLGG